MTELQHQLLDEAEEALRSVAAGHIYEIPDAIMKAHGWEHAAFINATIQLADFPLTITWRPNGDVTYVRDDV